MQITHQPQTTENRSCAEATINVGVVRQAAAYYPTGEEFFSPSELYPEYPFQHLSTRPNPVYHMLRELLYSMRLDEDRFGTLAWNPLGDWVQRGQRVFVLTNFVTDKRPYQSWGDFSGMVTHASVVRALVDYLIIATGDPRLVRFGNAPVQAALAPKLWSQTGAEVVRDFYIRETGEDLGPIDLRLFVSTMNSLGYQKTFEEFDPAGEVTFDLKTRSLLEALPPESSRSFRINDYGIDVTEPFHSSPRHLYKIHRQIIESDVVFHAAKLKTHNKVGLTGGLKGAVGAVSRKECLAHHRRGPAARGGDEFAHDSRLTRLYDRLGEHYTHNCSNVVRVAHMTLGRILKHALGMHVHGDWFGNDTAWRMALDINRCLIYGKEDGTLSNQRVRAVCTLLDGVVSGEGDGPIGVDPREDGILLLSNDAASADLGAAMLMGFDPAKIPLLIGAFQPGELRVSGADREKVSFTVNGATVAPEDVCGIVRPFRPPPGWAGHIEYAGRPRGTH
jgi:uncharacterized protein (DUF362 family)